MSKEIIFDIRLNAARKIEPGWAAMTLSNWNPKVHKPHIVHLRKAAEERCPGVPDLRNSQAYVDFLAATPHTPESLAACAEAMSYSAQGLANATSLEPNPPTQDEEQSPQGQQEDDGADTATGAARAELDAENGSGGNGGGGGGVEGGSSSSGVGSGGGGGTLSSLMASGGHAFSVGGHAFGQQDSDDPSHRFPKRPREQGLASTSSGVGLSSSSTALLLNRAEDDKQAKRRHTLANAELVETQARLSKAKARTVLLELYEAAVAKLDSFQGEDPFLVGKLEENISSLRGDIEEVFGSAGSVV